MLCNGRVVHGIAILGDTRRKEVGGERPDALARSEIPIARAGGYRLESWICPGSERRNGGNAGAERSRLSEASGRY